MNTRYYINEQCWAVGLGRFRMLKVLHVSCNTGTRALPDVSALTELVCTYQTMHSCLCYKHSTFICFNRMWKIHIHSSTKANIYQFLVSCPLNALEHEWAGSYYFIKIAKAASCTKVTLD